MSNAELLLQRARELPAGVLRILSYADEYRPTTTLACDRGARPIGYALEALCRARGVPFPSATQTPIQYRCISKDVPLDLLEDHVSDVLEEAAALADRPRLLLVDDHISTGDTIRHFRKVLRRTGMQAEVRWATYTGKGADLSCVPHMGPNAAMPWRDRSDLLGIHYTRELEFIDCSGPASQELYAVIDAGVIGALETQPLSA